MGIVAIVAIAAEPNVISGLGQQLVEIAGVSEAHSVAGGDTDLVAIVKVDDVDAIAEVVTERISKLPGIRSTNTWIAFRSFSSDSLDAAYEGFGD